MWSPDLFKPSFAPSLAPSPAPSPARGRARVALLAVGLALATGLGGCQVRPLYAVGPVGIGQPGEQAGVAAELGRIAVEVQRDRVGQELMNQLIFALRGGAALVDPAYTLSLIVARRETELAVQVREEVPTANLITLTTTFTLRQNATGRVLVSQTIYTTASYDFSSQRFANLRAERDAEDRAAAAAAADIRTRIAATLATGL